jgi:hypothetical protein
MEADRGWLAAGALTLLLALFFVYLALALRGLDCVSQTSDGCGIGSEIQLGIAVAGLIPAAGLLIQAMRGRGSLGVWFCATVLVYVIWGLFVWRWY